MHYKKVSLQVNILFGLICLIIVLHCKKTANVLTENFKKSTKEMSTLKLHNAMCNSHYVQNICIEQNQYGKFLHINTVHWDVFVQTFFEYKFRIYWKI